LRRIIAKIGQAEGALDVLVMAQGLLGMRAPQGESMGDVIKAAAQDAARDPRTMKILAKSVYRELRSGGHTQSDIVGFTNALLELVTTEMRDGRVDDTTV
jgi:hypothetical protein